jgi:hypothetical protein
MSNIEAQAIFLLRDHGLHKAVMVASGFACRYGADFNLWIGVVAHLDHLIMLNPNAPS